MTIEQGADEAVVKIRPDSPLGSRSSCLEDPWRLSVPMIWRAVDTGSPSGWFSVASTWRAAVVRLLMLEDNPRVEASA